MERIERIRRWLESHRELALDLLRIYLGLALFAKGISFIHQGTALMDSVRAARIGYSDALIARYVIIAHLGGGLLMAAGLVTRLAAAVQIPALAGAVLFVHWRDGFFTPAMTLELTLLVLFLLALYTFVGGGRWSLDHHVFRRSEALAAMPPEATRQVGG